LFFNPSLSVGKKALEMSSIAPEGKFLVSTWIYCISRQERKISLLLSTNDVRRERKKMGYLPRQERKISAV
jgi:hypothetical protein